MSATRNIKLDSLINKAFQEYYKVVNCPPLKALMEEAYKLGRDDEYKRCTEIAARVRKEIAR